MNEDKINFDLQKLLEELVKAVSEYRYSHTVHGCGGHTNDAYNAMFNAETTAKDFLKVLKEQEKNDEERSGL